MLSRVGGLGLQSSWQKRSLLFFWRRRPWNVHSQYALSTYTHIKGEDWKKESASSAWISKNSTVNWSGRKGQGVKRISGVTEQHVPCGSTRRRRWRHSDRSGPTPHQRPCSALLCSSWCSLTCPQRQELHSCCTHTHRGIIHIHTTTFIRTDRRKGNTILLWASDQRA